MFQKPWAGQLILCLTVKFACFLIFSSLPTFCQPASWTTAFRTLSNYTKSLTQSQSHKLSEDQHKLAAEMTLGALFIMYMCVYLRSWVALLLAGSSVRDLQLKAILPARLSVRSVSVATVAFRKPSQNEKNKSSAAQTKFPPKLGTRYYLKDWTVCTLHTKRTIQTIKVWKLASLIQNEAQGGRTREKESLRSRHCWASAAELDCVNIVCKLH